MKIENILELETGNENQIPLLSDRLFWQCWTGSPNCSEMFVMVWDNKALIRSLFFY